MQSKGEVFINVRRTSHSLVELVAYDVPSTDHLPNMKDTIGFETVYCNLGPLTRRPELTPERNGDGVGIKLLVYGGDLGERRRGSKAFRCVDLLEEFTGHCEVVQQRLAVGYIPRDYDVSNCKANGEIRQWCWCVKWLGERWDKTGVLHTSCKA